MSAFVESAASRETSKEIMEAILKVAGGNEAFAEEIWEHPRNEEMVAIVEIVTNNGMHETTDFVWGAAGQDWA